MELIESIDFISLERLDNIPEEHKRIVLERIKKSEKDPTRLLDWDKVQNDFILE